MKLLLDASWSYSCHKGAIKGGYTWLSVVSKYVKIDSEQPQSHPPDKTYTHTQNSMAPNICIIKCLHPYMYVYVCTQIYIYIYMYIYVCMYHTYIYICIYTYTSIYWLVENPGSSITCCMLLSCSLHKSSRNPFPLPRGCGREAFPEVDSKVRSWGFPLDSLWVDHSQPPSWEKSQNLRTVSGI